MHLIQSYALQSGQIIRNINILEKFYPLNINKFVLFHPWTKDAKSYVYWQDVIEIIYPVLKENDISIIQIGLLSEPLLPYCIDLRGKTSINQCAYLCSKSILALLCDSFCSHLAGHYNILRVVLISNNYKECVKPYFGSLEKEIILEPNCHKLKPSFMLSEGHKKQINEIKPEKIAESVCKLLDLPFDYPYETLYIGDNYTNKILETVPNAITQINNLGVDSVVVRMDYEFNEEVLQYQMQHCPVSIVTNKPINAEILKAYKPRIKQLFYVVEKNNDAGFAKTVQKVGVPLSMFSYLSEEELNGFKLDYLDIGLIQKKEVKTKEEIKELAGFSNLYYKSNKTTLSQGKIFGSKAAWLNNSSISNVNEISPVADNIEFWKEIEFFRVLKEKD